MNISKKELQKLVAEESKKSTKSVVSDYIISYFFWGIMFLIIMVAIVIFIP